MFSAKALSSPSAPRGQRIAFHTRGGNVSLRSELEEDRDKESFLCFSMCTVGFVLSINCWRDHFTLESICIALPCVQPTCINSLHRRLLDHIPAKEDVVWVASAGRCLQQLADFFHFAVFALLIQLVLSLCRVPQRER